MFTGIVQSIGTVEAVARDGGLKLTIRTGWPVATLADGASIAHAGVCLTATAVRAGAHDVDVSPETLQRTTLGDLNTGSRVNLERSLKLGDELGGHLVFGHVDALGEVTALTPVADSHRLVVRAPPDLLPLIAEKGSIAVDGVSLTVNAVTDESFEAMIIPHTWTATTLGSLAPGDRVNLEADMLARYVARQLGRAPVAAELRHG